MENLLECNICLEKYDNKEKTPRILKCGHTFCSKCLKELSKVNNNIDRNLPFIKCPLDKTIGHANTNIEEIPINRLIVDILDYNGFQMDKLTLKEENHNEEMNYVNATSEKLQKMEKEYFNYQNLIRDNLLNFMNVKNSHIIDINTHFNKMINILETQKTSSIYQIEKYSNDKINYFNQILQSVVSVREAIHFKIDRLEMIKNQRGNFKMTMADEMTFINSLGVENLESQELKDEVQNVLKESHGDYQPKVIIKNNSEELINSVKVMIPDKEPSNEFYSLTDSLEHLNINNSIFWFQQNSPNVYKKNLNDSDWILYENKDKFVFNEMFRVSMIGTDEALITGGGKGFVCSNLTIHFKNGNFKKKQNMFTERRSHSSCKANNFIYVCGGINSNAEPLIQCEKFNLETEKWIKISNMSVAKSHLSLCNVNNQYIYSIGGENKFQSLLDIIERYTINLDTWEVMTARIPHKIECAACVQISEDFLILGGYNCEKGSMNTVYQYDTTTNTIRKLNKELAQSGWSIYQPIKNGNNINVFYGGEEAYPPHHLIHEI